MKELARLISGGEPERLGRDWKSLAWVQAGADYTLLTAGNPVKTLDFGRESRV
jgi:hypothetical protein